ncbi:PAS domain S-box protein [Methylocystis sp. JAN1]|uniref:PAS domain S-box protein n=1 Tax=Methylocystis sp. JAN1 TaxID=3397211 RepID=UPI003FA2B24B
MTSAPSKAKALWERIFEALPQEAALLDENGIVAAVNARWTRSGDGVEIGESLLEFLRSRAPDDPLARRLLDGIAAVVAGATDAFSLSDVRDASSHRRWASIEARALPGGLGGALLLRNGVDGPSRRADPRAGGEPFDAAASNLRESPAELLSRRDELEWIYQNSPIGLCLLDRDLLYLRINRRLAEVNGLPVEAPVGRSLFEAVPAPTPRAREIARRLPKTAKPALDIELSGETPAASGERRRYWNTGWRPFLDKQGAIVGFGAVAKETTGRKRADEALRESEARLEQALAAANAGVWEFVPATGAFTASARARTLHGLAPDAPMDYDRALAAVYAEDRPSVQAALAASIEKGAPFKVEYRALQPDGTLRWLSSLAEARGEGADMRLLGLLHDIDERKRNEVALRESEERQAFLLTLTDALRQILDPGEIQAAACRLLGEYLGVNRVAYADIVGDEFIVRQGYARGVDPFLVRMPIADLGAKLVDSYGRGETVAISNVFAEEGFTEAELERFRTGQITALASVILSKQGRWVGTLCAHNAEPRAWRPLEIVLVREVAERIWSSVERARALAALRESEFRLQLALSSGKIGIYEADVESREAIWDERLRAFWGLPPDVPVNYGVFMQGIHPGDRSKVERAIGRALDPKGRRNVSFECRVMGLADGVERWVAATGAVFFEEDRAVRIVGTAQDITARKRAEAERQKFVALAEQSGEFIGICSLDYEPLYINPAGAALVGLERGRAPHPRVADFFFPEDIDFVGKFFERVRRDGHGAAEIRFRHFATGEALWMSYNLFVLRDDRNEPIGYATVSRDITERRRAEDALRDADRRKDEFLATLAHELRNPLAPIRNAVHVLLHGADATMRTGRDLALLAMVERQTEHLIRLVDDLLEVSRITRGKIELKKQRVDLGDVLRHAIETAQPSIDRARHQLRVAMPAEPIEVEVDPVRLAQVFTNLLNNAAKYTEPAGDISVSAERRATEVVVTVRDSGVGIPAEMLPRIFDLFTQVDRTLGRAQGGLGIGLALVKNLLELHGGAVEAQSDGLGRGAAFIVRLPIMPEKTTEERMPATASTKTPATRRILVIDDDHDVADSLVMFLETFGATVQVAYSGAASLDAFASFKPDLVFLDLGMPGMDGYETARRIRAMPEGRDVQLVALTGWGQEQINDRARAAGFDRQLTKPAGFEALQELLGLL